MIDAFERLAAGGLVSSRVGAGTFASDALRSERPWPPPAPAKLIPHQKQSRSKAMDIAVGRFGDRPRLPYAPRAFNTALPAFDAFPMAQWARLAAKHWRGRREDVMGYGAPFGHAGLREAIAAHLPANRGIARESWQIFIVGGAQQAFNLIGSVLLDPGDKVWFENPGAIGARNSLLACGAELVPVPVDASGPQVEEGMRRASDFRLVFATPSHQQPLGHVMSLERRLALLRCAEGAGAWIIEDDYDGEFFFGRRPPDSEEHRSGGRRDLCRDLQQIALPALRLGFMLVPPSLVDIFEKVSASFVHGVPSSVQAMVAEFIEEGHFAAHIRRMRRIYEERHAALCETAARELGGALDVMPTESGLHTTGHLRGNLSEIAVARAAAERDIVVSPIARFSIEPTGIKGLVLGFGGVAPPAIRSGIAVLGEVLAGELGARCQARRA